MANGELRKHIVKFAHIDLAVVGRQAHPDQQHFGFGALRLFDDVTQIEAQLGQRISAQSVVRTQFDDHDAGLMLRQGLGDALPATQAGLAADAGINHFELRMAMPQFLLQQTHPRRVALNSISG